MLRKIHDFIVFGKLDLYVMCPFAAGAAVADLIQGHYGEALIFAVIAGYAFEAGTLRKRLYVED